MKRREDDGEDLSEELKIFEYNADFISFYKHKTLTI